MRILFASIALVGLLASFATAQERVELNLDGTNFTARNKTDADIPLVAFEVTSLDGGLDAGDGSPFPITLLNTPNQVSLGALAPITLEAGATLSTSVTYSGNSSILDPAPNFAGSQVGVTGGVEPVSFPIPEPASGVLAAFGLLGILGFRRRR